MKQRENQREHTFTLLPYLWRYKWNYLAGIIVLMLVDLFNLYIPQYTGEIIDGLSRGFGSVEIRELLIKLL